MDNEQSKRGEGGEAQRVDMTFPQMSIIMSYTHTHAHTQRHIPVNLSLWGLAIDRAFPGPLP